MTPADLLTSADTSNLPPHFTLLRVTDVSTTPLSNQVQQTYFELHKRAMPELDVWTQGELQWGALDCDVLGMFYADPQEARRLAYSGDVNNVVSAHRYQVFAPDRRLLEMVVNGTVGADLPATIGTLRATECQFGATNGDPQIPVRVSMRDFAGRRTAMFGKTRLGKSNVVKLLAQGMIDATPATVRAADGRDVTITVGQLIFDLNGEYANDNPQDGSRSIRSANAARCEVYALTSRRGTPSRPLRLNFYEQPDSCMNVLASMLRQDQRSSGYIAAFASVEMPSIAETRAMPDGSDKIRAIRKIQMYWAVLHRAGFDADEPRLRALGLGSGYTRGFDPHFNATQRGTVHEAAAPPDPSNLTQLTAELEAFALYVQAHGPNSLRSSSGGDLFDADDLAVLKFLAPGPGRSGPVLLQPYRRFHDANAGDFVAEILTHLDGGRTVILDLGNATDEIRQYFSDLLSRAVFGHQEERFVSDRLGGHYVQLYFEEAHNLFKASDRDLTGPYARFAKEGAKFHIGMV
ncbi:MAG TPA: DUF87 domain-containing protein, partial [Tepidisphaeraceae bacterium]